jgi:hypothetical protein
LNKVSKDLAEQAEYYREQENATLLAIKDYTNQVQSHLQAAADLTKAARNGSIVPQPAVIEQILHDAGVAAQALMKAREDCEEYSARQRLLESRSKDVKRAISSHNFHNDTEAVFAGMTALWLDEEGSVSGPKGTALSDTVMKNLRFMTEAYDRRLDQQTFQNQAHIKPRHDVGNYMQNIMQEMGIGELFRPQYVPGAVPLIEQSSVPPLTMMRRAVHVRGGDISPTVVATSAARRQEESKQRLLPSSSTEQNTDDISRSNYTIDGETDDEMEEFHKDMDKAVQNEEEQQGAPATSAAVAAVLLEDSH